MAEQLSFDFNKPSKPLKVNVEKPSFRPHSRRVTNAPLGFSIAVVLIWAAQSFQIDVPQEVAMAITSIVSYIVGWSVKEKEVSDAGD